jgi:asparagine synthase (glutamine-hydrolysing)
VCGIAGSLETDLPESEWNDLLARMANAIVHRGPDDGGAWYDASAGVGLASRRLAIVDLSPLGHQPMISESGRYVIAFNGEIYNFREIRNDLEGLQSPPRFRGHSDTEALLAGVEQWGIARTLERVVGMFAIAIWDQQVRSLTLVRDRLGEKPLYYGWQGRRFLFGSELKALRAHPGFAGTIDRGALALYMRHRYIPSPYSIYDGIKKLEPGTMLTLSEADVRSARCPAPSTYWSAREVAAAGLEHPFLGSEEDAADRLESLLRDAVLRQMVADVPLGALLSGGIDSSTVVALMQSQSSSAIRTFTIGSGDREYDESSHASAVAKHLGTDHAELIVTDADARSVIPRLPTVYDEPFADPSAVPTLLVSQLASRHVTVALSGDGGDELFGGYSRHFWGPTIWARVGWLPLWMRRATAGALTSVSPRYWDKTFVALDRILPARLRQRTPGDKMQKLAPVLDAESPQALYRTLVSHWNSDSPVLYAQSVVSPETDPNAFPRMPHFAEGMMCLDLVTFLPDDVLVKADRASMAVSLEARAPFLDHRVVEYAWQLPLSMKLRDGRGKYMLRRVLERHVPPSLIDRPKSGFGVPIGTWLRGSLREWAEALLNERRLRSEGFLRSEPIQKKWEEHLSGQHNWQHILWDVLMFEAWLESNQTSHSV